MEFLSKETLAAGTHSEYAMFYNIKNGNPMLTTRLNTQPLKALATNHSHTLLASASGKNLTVWQLESWPSILCKLSKLPKLNPHTKLESNLKKIKLE